jgi:glycosyltransferase involved in cell wall biosynthesis
MKKLKIAFVGQKGLPARYGGVETHVEQVAVRLAAAGHEVWAYGRGWHERIAIEEIRREAAANPSSSRTDGVAAETPAAALAGAPSEGPAWAGRTGVEDGIWYKGVRLVFKSSIVTKHWDAATNTLLCTLDASFRHRFDIIHFQGVGPCAFAPIPRIAGKRVISTIHALDWRQVKWGALASRLIKSGEELGVRSSTGVIAVSRNLVDYLQNEYGVTSTYIPNGATIAPLKAPNKIHEFGLVGGDYILTVGRIIADRRIEDIIAAFQRIDHPVKLVIVGSELQRTAYSEKLESMAGERVIFTGDQFGDTLEELYSNCRFYVHASAVEGLPITVIEAMAHKRCVLLSDIPENQEAGGDVAQYFACKDVDDLSAKLGALLDDDDLCRYLGDKSLRRVEQEYNWDRISERTEEFYYENLS